MSLLIETSSSQEADRDEIEDRLNAYNRAHSPTKGVFELVTYVVRDSETGAMRGGLKAVIYGHWMFVEGLFVDAEVRGQGFGMALLERAEAKARAENLVGIWLDTFDIHAPKFYEKAGFKRFGTLKDYPRGHERYFYQKIL